MPHRLLDRILPEDLSDADVERLKRIGFGAAMAVLRAWRSPDPPRCTRLEFVERYVAEAGISDLVSQRYAISQATQFLTDPNSFSEYVPPGDLDDAEWLRFMIEYQGASDTDLAFMIARLRGGTIDVERVRLARERLGIPGSSDSGSDADSDTLRIIERLGGLPKSARDFLRDREWLKKRVVDLNMSDGSIARKLARIGVPCDRSTVRLYRRIHRLKRPGDWSKQKRPWKDGKNGS